MRATCARLLLHVPRPRSSVCSLTPARRPLRRGPADEGVGLVGAPCVCACVCVCVRMRLSNRKTQADPHTNILTHPPTHSHVYTQIHKHTHTHTHPHPHSHTHPAQRCSHPWLSLTKVLGSWPRTYSSSRKRRRCCSAARTLRESGCIYVCVCACVHACVRV